MIKNLKFKKYLIMLNIKKIILKDKMKDFRNKARMVSSSATYLILMLHNRSMIILEL